VTPSPKSFETSQYFRVHTRQIHCTASTQESVMKLTLLSTALLGGTIGMLTVVTTSGNTELSPATRDHLKTSMQGEAFAAVKYQLYAEHARKSGKTELADLFERTAKVERFEHLVEEAALAQLVRDDTTNLEDAIAGESYEIDTMYREFAEQARAAGDQAAASLFEEIRRDEMGHRDAFKAALDRLHTTARR
jgi:rubrerythrin